MKSPEQEILDHNKDSSVSLQGFQCIQQATKASHYSP